VHEHAREIRKRKYSELDGDKVREDFYGLHNDVKMKMRELGFDESEFYEFRELLDEAADEVTPYTAFAFGKTAKLLSKDPKKAYDEFVIETSVMMTESGAAKKRNKYLEKYSKANEVTRTLFNEIYEMHGKLNVVHAYLEEFFMMGFNI